MLKILIWELSAYRWYLKARGSDERNDRAFGNSKEVAAWCRTKNCYGLRLLAAGGGNTVSSCSRKMLMTVKENG